MIEYTIEGDNVPQRAFRSKNEMLQYLASRLISPYRTSNPFYTINLRIDVTR